MRTLSSIALALSLFATTASAKPRRVSPAKAAATAWMTACVHEHTGPVGGVTLREATQLCKAAQKRNKAAQRAAKAIEACEELVVEECMGDDGHDDSCEDDALRERGAFDVCTGHGPAAKGGK